MAVLVNPANPTTGAVLKELEGAAQALRVTLHVLAVREHQEIDDAFAVMARERAEALLVVACTRTWSHKRSVRLYRVRGPSLAMAPTKPTRARAMAPVTPWGCVQTPP